MGHGAGRPTFSTPPGGPSAAAPTQVPVSSNRKPSPSAPALQTRVTSPLYPKQGAQSVAELPRVGGPPAPGAAGAFAPPPARPLRGPRGPHRASLTLRGAAGHEEAGGPAREPLGRHGLCRSRRGLRVRGACVAAGPGKRGSPAAATWGRDPGRAARRACAILAPACFLPLPLCAVGVAGTPATLCLWAPSPNTVSIVTPPPPQGLRRTLSWAAAPRDGAPRVFRDRKRQQP